MDTGILDTGILAAAALALAAGTATGAVKWACSGFDPGVATRLCLRTGLLSSATIASATLLLVPRIPLMWDHTLGLAAAMVIVTLMAMPAIWMSLQVIKKR